MAGSYNTPGVYIEETNLPPSIAAVETGIPVFIGYTEKAIDINKKSLLLKPAGIKSLADYHTFFGGASNTDNFCLYESLQLFFANGGGQVYIISCGDYTEPVSLRPLLRGLNRSRKTDIPLIAIPDAVFINDEINFYKLSKKILQRCAEKANRFAILDTRKPTNNINNDIALFRNNIGSENLKWGAAYYPWVTTANGKTIPPSGAVCGVSAMVDASRGVWKAPANVSLNGVASVLPVITDATNETMNTDTAEGKSVNAIRSFTGKGILVWGARTLAGNDNEWRYVPVKRFFMMVEESVNKGTDIFVFENNDAATWIKVRAMIENFLTQLWRNGALMGVKTDEAFYLHCGLGTTMTQQDIIEGKLIIEIGMAMVRPAEFIILRLTKKMLSE